MPRDFNTYSPVRWRPPTSSFASTIHVSISDEMTVSVRSTLVHPGVRLVSIAVMFSVFK